MDERRYISVILPLKLEWEPSYYVSSEEDIRIGDRVRVMFAKRTYLGVVSETDRKPDIEAARILPALEIVRDMERVLPEEIALWRQVAEYYLCSVGEVYKAAYPAEKVNIEEARAAAIARTEQRRERIAEGIRVKIEKLRLRLDKKQQLAQKTKDGTKSKAVLIKDIEKTTEEIRLSESALEAALKSVSAVRTVQGLPQMPDRGLELTRAQEDAFCQIKKGFEEAKPVMLHGITGSGKTEIYIRLAKEAIGKGKNVLYLVPEIALSRQLENRLREHFGERMMTFHSGETAASRRDTADRIRSLKSADAGSYLVLGTRSSLFLPHHNIGLIIVDEEHDGSYKQESPAPRYHGRDTALMLSVLHRSAIILGSATPSLEEMYNCLTGRHMLVELKERFHGSEDSEIEIIDTRAERRKNGMKGNFSRKLIDQIQRALNNGEQVMILRSRRAWAPVIQCENCGDMPKCPHCNVSLSLHKSEKGDFTACHHCGYKAKHSQTCSKCGGAFKTLGAGTQKIEEEAKALFPTAEIARLDSDISQNKTKENQIIKDFSEGRIQILIGTQIVTKGFDFSKLTLVAVIAADTLLGMQDFRADEKAVQLLEQFRGRCGRREKKGRLVIQTSQPEHPVYQSIAQGTASNFSDTLLTERKDFGFPPYSRIIEVSIKDMFEDRAERMAAKLAKAMSVKLSSDIRNTVVGPYAPGVSKVADLHIRAIRVCLRKDKNLPIHKKHLMEALKVFEKENRYTNHISVNVDPS